MQSSGEARCCEDHNSVPCASLGALLPPLYYRYAFHTPALSAHSTHPPRTHTRPVRLVSSTAAWSAPLDPLHPARPSRPASSGTPLSAHSSRPTPLGPIFQARPSRTTLGPLSGFPVCPSRLVTLCTTLPTRLSLHAPSDPPFTTHPPSPRAATALPTNLF